MMHLILLIITILVGLIITYFLILFLLQLYDNLKYGEGLFSAVKGAAADCCGVVKSALRG